MKTMTISELLKQLEALKEKHGDLPVRVQTLSHLWDPEPVVRKRDGIEWVLLNP